MTHAPCVRRILRDDCRIWPKLADVGQRPALVTPAGRRLYGNGAGAECMVGLKALAALWATGTEISSTGSVRARPKQPAGSCAQLFGRSEPLFKRPTRASSNGGFWGSNSIGERLRGYCEP